MVAQLEAPVLRTEMRGAVARLWRVAEGEIVISGPAGTGKTRGILDWIHQRCAQERLRVLILRKTLESLKTSALVTYQEQVLYGFDGKRSLADGVSYFGGNTIRPGQFTYEATGSTIILGGMDNLSKVLSTEYDVIYVNEATELTLEEWEQLGGRTDRPRLGPERPRSLLLGDCNPGPPTHWIKRRAEEGLLQLWPTTHRDNPAMWDVARQKWTASGIRYLARLKNYTGVRRLRYLLGVWAAAEGQVYDAWHDGLHLVDREAIAAQLTGAWHFGVADWGWTNPGVLQVWAVDRDGRMVMVAEYYMTRRPIEGWWVPAAVALSRQFGFRDWACDPSEPQNIAQFRAAGLNARGAVNDLLPGITAVQGRLAVEGDGRPRLMIVRDALVERDEALVDAKLPFCTVQEIPEYVWAKNTGGQTLKDKPVDAMNHGLDCVRYAVAEVDLRGRRPLEAPQPVAGATHFQAGAEGAFGRGSAWGADPWG